MRPILPLVATLALCLVPQLGYAVDNLVVRINVAVYQLTLVWNTDGAGVVPADGAKTSEQRVWAVNGVWYDGVALASDGALAGIYNTNMHGRMTTSTVTAQRVTTDAAWTSLKNKTGAAVDLSVKATNATWSVGANPAAVLAADDITQIEVSKNAGVAYPITLTTANQVLASESVGAVIASDEVVPFDIRLTAPRTGSNAASGDLLVTVTSFISP